MQRAGSSVRGKVGKELRPRTSRTRAGPRAQSLAWVLVRTAGAGAAQSLPWTREHQAGRHRSAWALEAVWHHSPQGCLASFLPASLHPFLTITGRMVSPKAYVHILTLVPGNVTSAGDRVFTGDHGKTGVLIQYDGCPYKGRDPETDPHGGKAL